MSDNYWTKEPRSARAAGFGMKLPARAVTRRRFLSSVAVATGAGVMIACGGSDEKATTPAGAPQGAATQAVSGTQAAAQATPGPKGGNITTATVGTDAKSFHVYQTTDSVSANYQGLVYGGGSLTKRDPESLQNVGHAAEKWTVSDDKKTYTFTLKDIKWSDGTPMTTADYVWTFEQASKPENKYPRLISLQEIATYKALDAKTLQVTLKDALVIGLETADYITPLPKHVWEKYDWNDPVKNPEILNPTVVNGMWKLKEWKRDASATFVRNELYFDGPPLLDSTTYRIFGTSALAYQALKAGEIDYLGITPADVKEAKTLSSLNVHPYFSATGGYNYVGFNMRRPWAKDVRVRQAVSFATDRKGIIDAVAYGEGRPVYANYTESSWVFNPNVEKYTFDPKKSADLLKQAGYTLQGKQLMKDGQQLKMKILFNQGNAVREGISTVLQQQLADLGIAAEVIPMEFQAYLELIKKEPFDYDLFVLGWTASIDPHWSIQIWNEKGIPDLNSGGYINKQVEALYDQGAREFETEKRKQIYGQIQKHLSDDPPYVFVYEGRVNFGANKKLGGIVPTRIGVLYNQNQWFLNK